METQLNKFMEVYELKLRKAILETPGMYAYGANMIPHFVSRMRIAVPLGNFALENRSIKDTCRELGIPPTYISIARYLRGES